MRVVLITPEYPPAPRLGGIGTHSSALAPALAGLGHDVCVLTRGDPGAEERDGVRIERLDHRWLPDRGAAHLLSLRTIAAAARRFRPDVVQAPEWEAEGWWLARFGGAPLVTRLATPTYVLEELNRPPPDRRAALVRRLERDQARRSAAVYAPTRAILDRVGGDWELDPTRLLQIPNPVSIAQIRAAGAGSPPIDLPERFLVFLGRIERRKGVETLCAALQRVLGADPDAEAILVGRDPGNGSGSALTGPLLRAAGPVADRIRFTGELPREQALAIVARATLAVFPSLWESFGYVALEAMALGVPVVASRAGGLAELIEDGRTGWLVPPGDERALAETLAERLAAGTANRTVAQAASKEAERYDVVTVVGEIVALYQHVAGGLDASIYTRGYRRYFRADDPRDPFHRLYARKRDAVLQRLGSGDRLRVLDVGGGYGRLATPLAERHDVTLVDVSEEMLAEARERCPSAVELVAADARELPFPDASFDVVLALDLLVHLPDLDQGLRELARVTRAGGQVVFDTTSSLPFWVLAYPSYVNWRPKRLARTLLAGGVLPEWRELVRHHRVSAVRAAAADNALQIERIERFGPPWSAKWHLWWTRKP